MAKPLHYEWRSLFTIDGEASPLLMQRLFKIISKSSPTLFYLKFFTINYEFHFAPVAGGRALLSPQYCVRLSANGCLPATLPEPNRRTITGSSRFAGEGNVGEARDAARRTRMAQGTPKGHSAGRLVRCWFFPNRKTLFF